MQNINCKSQRFVHGVVKGDVTTYEGKAGKSRCSVMPLSALRRNLWRNLKALPPLSPLEKLQTLKLHFFQRIFKYFQRVTKQKSARMVWRWAEDRKLAWL